MRRRGILSQIKLYLERRRLGELLVSKGYISPQELKLALGIQAETKKPLGQIFLESAVISKRELRMMLFKQTALRTCAAAILCFASIGGIAGKKARAGELESRNPNLVMVSATQEFSRVSAYPALFGMSEKRSTNLKPFTKWTKVMARFESQLRVSDDTVKQMEARLQTYRGGSIKAMAESVNRMMNEKPYISDAKNWGTSDYWATPVEFMKRGGDCEDFAIAKYAALRTLGVPEERLRIAIVQDLQKNIPHAVLVVYTEDGAYMLDNQIKTLVDAERGTRYKPIYSINRQAWWLHKDDGATRVASR